MRGFEFARKVEVVDEVKTKVEEKAYEDAQIPEYQTKNSAGADFFCAEEVQIPSVWGVFAGALKAKGIAKLASLISADNSVDGAHYDLRLIGGLFKPTRVHTGIKAFMEEDEVLEVYNRSSNPGKLGLVLANGVGVVDPDYYNSEDNDGEIGFDFYNFMPWTVTIKVGDRIGQGVFKKVLRPTVGLRVKDVERVGGFGSTNK